MARVKLRTRNEKVSFEQSFFVRRPDRMRVEILGLFDRTEAVLAAGGGTVRIFIVRENRFVVGPAGRGVLRRFAPIPLEPRDMVDLFLGGPPDYPMENATLTRDEERETWSLGPVGGGPGGVLRFDPRSRRIVGCALRLFAGRFVYEAAFSRYGPDDLPRRLLLTWEDGSASFSFYDLEPNAEIPDEEFDLRPPPGATVEILR